MTSFHGLSLHVTITVAPENASEFLKRSKPSIDLVAAEPECLYFEVFQSAERPGQFKLVENWSKDKEWFMKHQLTKPYYKPYEEATKPLWIEERTFEIFDRLPGGWAKAKAENVQ